MRFYIANLVNTISRKTPPTIGRTSQANETSVTNTTKTNLPRNVESISSVDALEQISKHIYKLQSFDFFKNTNASCERRNSSTSVSSSISSSDTSIQIISGNQAKRLSWTLAKTKKNLSEPILSNRFILPQSTSQQPTTSNQSSALRNSNPRNRLFDVSITISGLFKRLIDRATNKEKHVTKTTFKSTNMNKAKSKSLDSVIVVEKLRHKSARKENNESRKTVCYQI